MSKKIENLSFEESLNYLDSIIEELESNDISLEDSLKKYEEGIAVARSNQKKLEEAELKIHKIKNQQTE